MPPNEDSPIVLLSSFRSCFFFLFFFRTFLFSLFFFSNTSFTEKLKYAKHVCVDARLNFKVLLILFRVTRAFPRHRVSCAILPAIATCTRDFAQSPEIKGDCCFCIPYGKYLARINDVMEIRLLCVAGRSRTRNLFFRNTRLCKDSITPTGKKNYHQRRDFFSALYSIRRWRMEITSESSQRSS